MRLQFGIKLFAAAVATDDRNPDYVFNCTGFVSHLRFTWEFMQLNVFFNAWHRQIPNSMLIINESKKLWSVTISKLCSFFSTPFNPFPKYMPFNSHSKNNTGDDVKTYLNDVDGESASNAHFFQCKGNDNFSTSFLILGVCSIYFFSLF